MNDRDLWKDIKELEKAGKLKQAKELLEVFYLRYIEYDAKMLKICKDDYEKKYNDRINI